MNDNYYVTHLILHKLDRYVQVTKRLVNKCGWCSKTDVIKLKANNNPNKILN